MFKLLIYIIVSNCFHTEYLMNIICTNNYNITTQV